MIKEIYYEEEKMHIKDNKGNEIIANEISFTEAFEFAQSNNVIFHYKELTIADAIQFSSYLQREVGSCNNRHISDFFLSINKDIQTIVDDDNLFGTESIKKTVRRILTDHKKDVAFYNIEAYGTDTYIAQTVYEELKTAQKKENTTEIKILLSIVDKDEYDLDTFIKAVKKLAPRNK